jgi:CRISPR-associated protein Csm3
MKIDFQSTHALKAVLEVQSGLRIGAGKDTVEIGGIDNPIIKHPHPPQHPYIPGSSLKGKLRSLLEWALGRVHMDGKVWGSNMAEVKPGDVILRAFGVTSDKWHEGPSRLIVRDAPLVKDWADRITKEGLAFTEAKTEVTINRIQGKAAGNMGPRTMERVPSGALFDVEMLFKQYSVDGDNGAGDLDALNRVIEAMRLLEQDALGGCGSRGCGRVAFSNVSVDGKDITGAFRSMPPLDKQKPHPFVTGGNRA